MSDRDKILPDWIAVDWGTSTLRAWAMAANGEVLARETSDDGMNGLAPEAFEPTLLALISQWNEEVTPIVCCGMVGSRQGWREAPYRTVSCAPIEADGIVAVESAPTVHIIGGVCQETPADVMRGEETQIAGLLAAQSIADGVVCLPGTHTKWVEINGGKIVRFQTFMTGEMFALLRDKSVLRYSVQGDWEDAAFAESVTQSLNDPNAAAAGLFSIRAEGLLGKSRGISGLSGILIGAEIAAARNWAKGCDVHIVGASKLASYYAQALDIAGLSSTQHDAETLTLAGLTQGYRMIS